MTGANHRMTHRIIAVTNQKGGVGKTTTTINLAAALAECGLRTLIIDLDPQGNASTGLGVDQNDRIASTYDLLFAEDAGEKTLVRPTGVANLFIVPANADLASADLDLMRRPDRTSTLKRALARPEIQTGDFAYILIDCPPSLSLLTLNALVACNTVLVPLQAEFFALEGLSQLMLTVREIRQNGNPDLRIEGVVITMFDGRNRLAQQVEEDVRKVMGDLVFTTKIPRNVRLSEAPSYAVPVLVYDTLSKGSEAYRALAKEVDHRRRAAVSPERIEG
jgi:chromosome partitioning protein